MITSAQVMDLTDGGTWRKSGKLPERRYAGKGANLAGPWIQIVTRSWVFYTDWISCLSWTFRKFPPNWGLGGGGVRWYKWCAGLESRCWKLAAGRKSDQCKVMLTMSSTIWMSMSMIFKLGQAMNLLWQRWLKIKSLSALCSVFQLTNL